jgi:hypothetical protein
VSLTLNLELVVSATLGAGLVGIELKDNNNERFSHSYYGTEAVNMIKFLNTANLTTKSLHKRVLEKLSTDGVLPGTVTGTPDPPVL